MSENFVFLELNENNNEGRYFAYNKQEVDEGIYIIDKKNPENPVTLLKIDDKMSLRDTYPKRNLEDLEDIFN